MRAAFAALVAVLLAVAGCVADVDAEPDDEVDVESDDAALSSDVRLETTFTDGKAAQRDMAILSHVIRLIDDTPAGESIRIAIHSIAANVVQRALVRAKERGVDVRVVHNGADFASPDDSPKALAAALGSAHRWCGNIASGRGEAGGCISSHPSSLMHSKLALFSRTKDGAGAMRSWVSWFGSANMTFKSGADTYNDTTTVYGDRRLYDAFTKRYWAKLWAQDRAPRNDFFDGGARRGYFGSRDSGITVYASPEQDGDLVLRRLAEIAPGPACRVRVAQSMIYDSRLAVVERLGALKRGGCRVQVAVNEIQPRALRALERAGIAVRRNETHDKIFLVDARYAGSARRRRIVFTGSHNWTASANSVNDELLVRIENPAAYGPFVRHFERVWSAGR